jgi:hypothetical protein
VKTFLVREIIRSGLPWASQGAALLLLARALDGCKRIPETIRDLQIFLGCTPHQGTKVWNDILPIIPELVLEVERQTRTEQRRSKGQSSRWEKSRLTQVCVNFDSTLTQPLSSPLSPPTPPPITPPNPLLAEQAKSESKPRKVQKLKLQILPEAAIPSFELLWKQWPGRKDGRPSRGDKPKAQQCWKAILDSGLATPEELLETGLYYTTFHPAALEGFVRMVSTVFALKDGIWREILPEIQNRTKEIRA